MPRNDLWWLPKSFFLLYRVIGKAPSYSYVSFDTSYEPRTGQYKVLRQELNEHKGFLRKRSFVLKPIPNTPFFNYYLEHVKLKPEAVALPLINPNRAFTGAVWMGKEREIEIKAKEAIQWDTYEVVCWKTEGKSVDRRNEVDVAWYDCQSGLLIQQQRLDENTGTRNLWLLQDTDINDLAFASKPLWANDPRQVIAICETQLAEFISNVMTGAEGDAWWEGPRVSGPIRGKADGRKQDREKEHEANLSPIHYINFGEYIGLIRDNKDLFLRVLGANQANGLLQRLEEINRIRGMFVSHGLGTGIPRVEFLRLKLYGQDVIDATSRRLR